MIKPSTNVDVTFGELASALPHFADGRVDYTGADRALVVTAVVFANPYILLLKRSGEVGAHAHTWSAVSGFIDRAIPPVEMALAECREELGFSELHIRRVSAGDAYENADHITGTTWINVPVLVEVTGRHQPTLDWEHVDHAWVEPSALTDYDLMPGMDRAIERALALR